MQLGARENKDERFAHYSEKTFKKTASLIAYSCQAVSLFKCFTPRNKKKILIFFLNIRSQCSLEPILPYKLLHFNMVDS